MADNGDIELVGPETDNFPKGTKWFKIGWSDDHQMAFINFDPKIFKNWEFVKAILDTVTEKVKTNIQVGQMQNMQRAALEQAQAQQLANSLRLGQR